ncbi:hypothetical protein ABT255_52665 [Streptomyces mirabilis]|uniref:hypothetical protein n=1 Tax=Streptomyces mirabilis TaxID=68239 RepID=UPI003323B178
MIEYVPYSGEPEAMNCPAAICDTCREQVVGEGNIVWCIRAGNKGEQRQQSPLFASHEGGCDCALGRWLEAQYPLDDNWINLSDEIDVFLKQLGNNVGRSFADDPRGDYHQVIVRMPTDPLQEQPR